MYLGSRVGQAKIVFHCWRKPRNLVDISQHRKKVIQKTCLGKYELWAKKRETHINCRIYSGAGSFALNLSPGPLARNLKMIFPAMWWGLKWDCWCEGMAAGLIVIDVDWQIWVLFSSVFKSALWLKVLQNTSFYSRFNRLCPSTSLVDASLKRNLWIYVRRISSPVITNAKHVEAQKEFKKV